MQCLAFLQHLEKLAREFVTVFLLFGSHQPPYDGVAIHATQGFVERLCLRTSLELAFELGWHYRVGGRVIRRFPATILFRALDFRQSTRSHASALDQRERLAAIDHRPETLGSSRQKAMQIGPFALRMYQRVDPPIAQRAVQRFLM